LKKLKYLGLSLGIFGCLFKLMSWAYASELLMVGLTLLGIYFFSKTFEKSEKEQ